MDKDALIVDLQRRLSILHTTHNAMLEHLREVVAELHSLQNRQRCQKGLEDNHGPRSKS